MPFEVFVDDNFHPMNESERDQKGRFATYEEAVAVAQRLVEASVEAQYRDGMTEEQLWDQYSDFGEDPFVRPSPLEGYFSAWDYARAFIPRFLARVSPQGSRPAI